MTNKQPLQEDWEKSLNIDVRFPWATDEQRNHILAEIKFQRNMAKQQGRDDDFKIIDGINPKDGFWKHSSDNPHFVNGFNAAKRKIKRLLNQARKGLTNE